MKNRNLNILQILPNLESGGVERGTLEIADYLARAGHNSYVISGGGRLVTNLQKGGSHHITLPIGKKSPLVIFNIFKLLSIYKKYKIDIVHVRSRLPAWITLFSLKLMKKKERPKFVTTIHGYNSVSLYSSIMTKGDAVLIVSHALKRFILANYHIEKRKITVNHRGVPDKIILNNGKKFSEWIKNWEKKYPSLKEKKLLTLPARISRHKGLEDFIDLIHQLKVKKFDIHGLIVGEAKSKNYLLEIKKYIDSKDLSSNITFLGYQADIYEIMKISYITFSLSSLPEAFGRTVIESIKLGVPVIGYSHGGVGEQLKLVFPEGLISMRTKSALVKKTIEFIKQQPEVRPTKLFSLENMQKNTLAIYKDLLKN